MGEVITESIVLKQTRKGLSLFEKYLSVWVMLCIMAGIMLGKVAPGFAKYLDSLAIYVGEAPVVSIPIAICLFFMMYPIMVKIDFGEVVRAGKNVKPVALTLFVNWAIKPFTMYAISIFFLGTLFYGFIGPEAVDYVKMPLGLNLPVGATRGAGTVVMVESIKMLEVPLWRSYLDAFCWGLPRVLPWCWCGAFWPGEMTATPWSWWPSIPSPCSFSMAHLEDSCWAWDVCRCPGRLWFYPSPFMWPSPWWPASSRES